MKTYVKWSNAPTSSEICLYEYKDTLVYYIRDGWNVGAICCGDRYAHSSPGFIGLRERFRCSYSCDWHGGPDYGSLEEVLDWIIQTPVPELGCSLWFTDARGIFK